jgi:DNA-binding ferritin-like protein
MIYHKKTKKQKQNKTKRGGKKLNKTIKTRSIKKSLVSFEKEILVKFLEMLNAVKLFHWKTYSFAIHEATDKLYESLNKNIDRFMEVLIGKMQNKIDIGKRTLTLKSTPTLESFKSEIISYKTYLVNLDKHKALKTMSNSDLFSIRDEILGDLNLFLYLSTFK